MRPLRAVFDWSALAANYALARRAARGARAFAVIKADAYGHGYLKAAQALRDADGFALLEIDRAVELRDRGFRQPILLLEGFFSLEELAMAEAFRLSVVVHSLEQLRMLAGTRRSHPLQVFLKLNTGMNRLGLQPGELAAAKELLKAARGVESVVLMTHFATADEPSEGVQAQLERFNAMTAGLGLPRSLANSAALLRYPQTHGDWVRPGIMLYGSSPFADQSAEALGLRPVMTLESRVIAVQSLQAGDRVGYGGTFTAPYPMRIGIVACGYADGYPRHAPTGTPVLVNGVRTRTVGRVSMDMLSVDLTPVPDAGLGAQVTLWGEGLSVDEVARAAGTLSYELLCRLTSRVPREDR